MRTPASVGNLHRKCSREKEDELIDLAIKGDKDAFSYLYQHHYGLIYGFCTRMLHGRSEVEDAVQQVFLEAWRSLYRFEKRSLFSTWLTKIAIHTCLSFHRKASRIFLTTEGGRDLYQETTDMLWGQPVPLPSEQLWLADRRRAIIKIINRLTKKKQVVFILSDMQGMTAPEISRILGIPDATVRTRLFHARREFAGFVKKSASFRYLLSPSAEHAEYAQ